MASYEKTIWNSGDTITAVKMNNLEDGVEAANNAEITVTASATVDNTTGTPAVDVTASGTALTFAFTGLKGEKGEKGDTGEQGPQGEKGETGATGATGAAGADGTSATITSASATVDDTSGDPACTVTLGGTSTARTFTFAFTGIKGEKGDTGATGAKGDTGATGAAGAAGAAGADGKDAPTITACEINVDGETVSGKLTLSDASTVDITGTYSAE